MTLRMKTAWLWGATAATLSVLASIAFGQQNTESDNSLQVIQVRPNFYMIAGADGNIGMQAGPDGVVLIDTGPKNKAKELLATIKRLAPQPIRYIINTSADPDRVGGNEIAASAGASLSDVSLDNAIMAARGGGGFKKVPAASIVATENVLTRMSAPAENEPPYPSTAWPLETTFTRRQKSLYFNNEPIIVLAQPAAHTDGDAFVLFRRSDVVVAGNILDMTRFPVIDLDKGGSIQGEIDALNRLLDLTIPAIPMPWKEGGTKVIPGRGRVCDQAEVVEYRDMVTVIRDRIRDLIKRGKTLQQVKAADPTQGYRSRYGTDSGPWTTTMFIEAVYRDLASKKR